MNYDVLRGARDVGHGKHTRSYTHVSHFVLVSCIFFLRFITLHILLILVPGGGIYCGTFGVITKIIIGGSNRNFWEAC